MPIHPKHRHLLRRAHVGIRSRARAAALALPQGDPNQRPQRAARLRIGRGISSHRQRGGDSVDQLADRGHTAKTLERIQRRRTHAAQSLARQASSFNHASRRLAINRAARERGVPNAAASWPGVAKGGRPWSSPRRRRAARRCDLSACAASAMAVSGASKHALGGIDTDRPSGVHRETVSPQPCPISDLASRRVSHALDDGQAPWIEGGKITCGLTASGCRAEIARAEQAAPPMAGLRAGGHRPRPSGVPIPRPGGTLG